MAYDAARLEAIEGPLNNRLIKVMGVSDDFYYYHYRNETAWVAYVFAAEIPGFVQIVEDIKGMVDFESLGDADSLKRYEELVDGVATDF